MRLLAAPDDTTTRGILPQAFFDEVIPIDSLSYRNELEEPSTYFLVNSIGDLICLWELFDRLRDELKPEDRLILIQPNSLYRFAFFLLGLFDENCPTSGSNRINANVTEQLLRNRGMEVRKKKYLVHFPVTLPPVGSCIDALIRSVPFLEHSGFFWCLVSTPQKSHREINSHESVSVLVPAKNEKGHISRLVDEIPDIGSRTEVIFIEGGSNDGTRKEITNKIASYSGELELRLVDQGDDKGKADAVRKGAQEATGEILMILDADLTVPPDDLRKFYRELREGDGVLVNGTRMMYPMEEGAMRSLNYLANDFFAFLFGFLVENPITDTLCGTKVLYKKDFERIQQTRNRITATDPYGDFDLLLGAVQHDLEVVEVPVRYRARDYGRTKIARFIGGYKLLKVMLNAFWELKIKG